MRPYAERRAARVERLTRAAERASAGSNAAFGAARSIGDMIPFGQPILVGHHSERRARRDADRITASMGKAVALGKQAEELSRRAHAAESNAAISSDDPEAVVQLRAKLAKITVDRDRMKEVSAAIRKTAKLTGGLRFVAIAVKTGITEKQAEQLLTPDFAGRIGFAPYELTNRGAEIRRIEGRIAHLTRKSEVAAVTPREELRIGGTLCTCGDGSCSACDDSGKIGVILLVRNNDENRVQMSFPGKPADAVRTELKRNGFRWSPSEGAWQRQESWNAWEMAQLIAHRAMIR